MQEGRHGSNEELPAAGFNARVREVERAWRKRSHTGRGRNRGLGMNNMQTSGAEGARGGWRMRKRWGRARGSGSFMQVSLHVTHSKLSSPGPSDKCHVFSFNLYCRFFWELCVLSN